MVRKNLLICGLVAAVFVIASPGFSATKKSAKKPQAKPAVTAPTPAASPTPISAAPTVTLGGVPFETKARTAVMVDLSTGTILLEKDPDRPIPPASMTKIMTIYLLFEQLKKGAITMDTTFMVSEKAWRTGGSKMFVPLGQRVRVEDLIRGIIIQSGNDASVVVAEGLAGDEARFAEMMNRKAAELGMTHSHFLNADGLPAEGHMTSARDL
ncbi:MAG: serine hydrolase, partial [Alphaproteobacteria bacterium]